MRPDSERRKQLKEQYNQRHPDKGIACWKSKGAIWVNPTEDANADYNCTRFQLELGTWVNRNMQKAYNEDPESFEWELAAQLDYDDIADDCSLDLEIMLMEFMEKHPDAKLMKPLKKRRVK